jgi:putative FmdB family regulatory protein
MARYDYKCHNCGEFEAEHSVNDVLTKCPKCQSEEIKRLISKGTNFILLGDSWAKTNYK